MVICLQKTKKYPQTSQVIDKNHAHSRSMQVQLLHPLLFASFTQHRWSSYRAGETPTYMGGQTSFNVDGDSCWTFQDLDQAWKAQILSFAVFGKNVLSWQPFSVPAGLFWRWNRTGLPFSNALVVWRTSLGWAWANGFMWFDSLCLNQLPLVCSAVITCCVHTWSISELCVKASLCKHRPPHPPPPRQAVLSQLLALVYPLFQCPIYDMSKESD